HERRPRRVPRAGRGRRARDRDHLRRRGGQDRERGGRERHRGDRHLRRGRGGGERHFSRHRQTRPRPADHPRQSVLLMATRAERFRAESERSKPKRPKTTPRPSGRRAPTAREAERELGSSEPAPHNFHASERNPKTYAYEVSAKRPSRKSTRISEDHVKTGVELQHRQLNRTTSPSARAKRR